jgi:hypothetical protein
METAPTVKAFAAMNMAATMKAFPVEAISKVPAITEVAATVEPRVAIKAWSAVKAAEPRAGADKNAAGEVARPVITVRRARVGIVSIVAVLAYRGWTDIGRADSNAENNSLCMSVRRGDQANAN